MRDIPIGTLELTRCENPGGMGDKLIIRRADPCIWITDEFLVQMESFGRPGDSPVRHPLGWTEVEAVGDKTVVRINGENRSVTYMLDHYEHQSNCWLARWPD